MQQYYEVDVRGVILSVFHSTESVGLDIEHFGNVSIDDEQRLRELFERECGGIEIESDRGATAQLTRTDAGGLRVAIQGRDEITVELTAAQFATLVDSLGEGDDSVGYDVEWVGADGVRETAEE